MDEDLRQALAHVLWLGGSVCAGKSTISDMLAERYQLQVYHCDRHEYPHIARRSADASSALTTFAALTMDERWLLPTPEAMVATSIRYHTERFALIVEDLLAMPRDAPILVEGFGLYPAQVTGVVQQSSQALWLVASPEFLAAMRHKRGMTVPDQTSDPERARANLIARDILWASALRRDLAKCGLPLIVVDGSQPIDETAAAVASHFGLA